MKKSLLMCYDLLITRPKLFIELLKNKKYYKAESYYPLEKHKSTFKIFLDQIRNIFKYGEFNVNYFMHGFDVIGLRESDDFVPRLRFRKTRNRLNGYPYNNSISILRDKLYFEIVAKSFGFNTPKNLGILNNGEVFSLISKEFLDFKSFLSNYPNAKFFLKIIDGLAGDGIYSLSFQNEILYVNGREEIIEDFLKSLGNNRYIIQESIIQNERMNQLYPKAVNTIRIVTVRNNNKAELFFSFLRLGAHDLNVDNMSRGGLKVDIINEMGQLNSLGFYMPEFGTTTEFHPDTNIKFSEFVIPHYQEAVNQVLQFHDMLPSMHSIGWDVAITPSGPIIVEANDNWGYSLHKDTEKQKIKFKELFH